MNYHTTYRKVSAKKIIRTVNVKGESIVKGGKCTMEKMRPQPRTVTAETTREVKPDPQVANFMRQHNISVEHAIELMGNYHSHNNTAIAWEQMAKEELVELINLDF